MLDGISRVESRIAAIEQRLAVLDPSPAAATTASFAQELKTASTPTSPESLAPATVANATDPAASTQQPPHWLHVGAADSPAECMQAVREAAQRHGVSQSLAAAVARVESDFTPDAVSKCGAQGLMQLMPDTARSLGVSNPFDAEQNAEGGVRYLATQFQRFGDVEKALAAYNAGPGAVNRYGGVPPFPETRAYVNRVMEYERQYRASGMP